MELDADDADDDETASVDEEDTLLGDYDEDAFVEARAARIGVPHFRPARCYIRKPSASLREPSRRRDRRTDRGRDVARAHRRYRNYRTTTRARSRCEKSAIR